MRLVEKTARTKRTTIQDSAQTASGRCAVSA